MNVYEITLRKVGRMDINHYNVVAETLELAIEHAKSEIPNDFGSEFNYELVSAKEVAWAVLLPKAAKRAKA